MVTTALHSGLRATADSAVLFDRWCHHGDRQAREVVIEQFLPLARRLARKYVRSSVPYDDLVQVASLGLVKAVDRFDPDRGLAFSSFAVPTILGELKRYFRDSGWAVHVPRGAQERARQITDAQQAIMAHTGKPPTVRELGRYLEMSDEDLLEGMRAAEGFAAESLDAPRPGEDGGSQPYLDGVGAVDLRLELVDDAETVLAAAKGLPEREREVLFLRFARDLTQTEIAKRLGVSQMQISRLLRRALQSLHDATADDR